MSPGLAIAAPPARILIVDDDRQNRQLLEVMLAPEGFVLVTAASGEDALAMVALHPPDLILLDVMMPGMNGYEVAARLKGDLATRSVPIIMVTALGDRNARMLGLRAGAEDFLAKPVDRAELCLRVRNLLDRKGNPTPEGEVAARPAELVERDRLEQAAFDAAPVGMVRVGLQGQWLRVNQRLCDLLGYARKELQSLAVFELIQSEEVAGEAEAFRQVAAGTRDGYVLEGKHYRRQDGSLMIARVSMSVHRDGSGQPEHVVCVIDDVTAPPALT